MRMTVCIVRALTALILARSTVSADDFSQTNPVRDSQEQPFSILRYLTPPSRLDVPGLVGSLTIGKNVHATDWRKAESQFGIELRYRYLLFDLALAQGDFREMLATPNSDPYGFHRGKRIGNLAGNVGLTISKVWDVLMIPFVGGGVPHIRATSGEMCSASRMSVLSFGGRYWKYFTCGVTWKHLSKQAGAATACSASAGTSPLAIGGWMTICPSRPRRRSCPA